MKVRFLANLNANCFTSTLSSGNFYFAGFARRKTIFPALHLILHHGAVANNAIIFVFFFRNRIVFAMTMPASFNCARNRNIHTNITGKFGQSSPDLLYLFV